ncbi:sodium:proton antiporter [Shewanella sp. NKUCC05_KAH]|uniref:Na+/H+ antiporter NhaC family protein n=1 Tax=Shewanella TaxID=22 RepID=UPI00156A3849|nr:MULTISPECIES: Na+/H+ antiporter NhaC family protein [unclassified Shewanella]MBW3527204.1 sodium:proton antiporter [Shewanella sp. NKUCC05_KAH]MCU7976313.1 sodium:proton antiporter [Shewanella sp. SW36]MCU7991553.1 sodium:proton antiporter [Shewanella sp. SW1]MCU8012540.1 sodium:proton antiporter [Shewanella sp. SM74]MCU8018960.1 sodium:proton antiporter [Shewanella sp. SM72]
MSPSLLAILPLLLTLTLALFLRRTLVALGVGIVSGALLIAQFDPLQTGLYLLDIGVKQFYAQGAWQAWHLNVLFAMLLLGSMTQLLARGGAVGQFGDWLYSRIRTERQARLGVVFLGWLVFIDGIFSCLAVGHVCQPLSQRYGIRHEQLAYLVDSNASPLCALLPFSSWGPYVMALIAGISFLPVSPLEAFIEVALFNFYAIVTLGLSVLVAWYGVGFHSFVAATAVESSNTVEVKGNPWLLAIPMLTLLSASVGLTLWSGAQQVSSWDVSLWLAKADIGASMRDACLLATLVTLAMLGLSGRRLTALVGDLSHGVRMIAFAIAILLCTWMIGAVIQDLGVAKLLAAWAKAYLSPHLLVAGMFLLCAIMAFATGSSWGTFAIMIPIGAEIAHNLDPHLLLPVLSAVMAGSVFGDHCSPISDTSVLSATSSGCAPHDHVVTQLPFALIAACAALVGFQLVNLAVATPLVWLAVVSCSLGLFALMARFYSPLPRFVAQT